MSAHANHAGEPYRGPWTDGEVDHLRRLVEAGSTIRESAAALGRTMEAVKGKAYANGLQFGWTDRKRVLVKEALDRAHLDADHDWADFTVKRLTWLYGEERAHANFDPARNADLQAWNSLGKGRAA